MRVPRWLSCTSLRCTARIAPSKQRRHSLSTFLSHFHRGHIRRYMSRKYRLGHRWCLTELVPIQWIPSQNLLLLDKNVIGQRINTIIGVGLPIVTGLLLRVWATPLSVKYAIRRRCYIEI